MSSNICSVCSSKMVKNGKTKAGTQRYRCLECGSSQSRRYSLQARELKLFLDWLLGKQLQRDMLCNHRGLSELRRIKAVFWWCYMHTEAPLEPAEILRSMPRNKDLQTLINAFRPHRGESIYPDTYGNAVVWSELHHSDPSPYTAE